MLRFFLALLFVPATSLLGQSIPGDEKVANLASDLRTLSRIVEVAKDLSDVKPVLLTIVDQNIESLRIKRADGTYRWASLQREEGRRETKEKSVDKVQSEKDLNTLTVTTSNAYRVEVIVPRKRNLVSANNRVYVRNVLVDSTGFDGKTTHQEIAVNAWVNPGDTQSVPLTDIGKSVRATVELGVESGNKQAVANVALLEAKLVDDPTSPYFPAMTRLLQIRTLVKANEMQRGALKTSTDEALLALPGEMEKRGAAMAEAQRLRKEMVASGTMRGTVAAGDATPDVMREISEVQRLLNGTLDEQAEGRRRLKALSDTLTGTAQ